MSEGLRKLLVAKKSGTAGRQSGTLDLSNPGNRIVACGLILKISQAQFGKRVRATAMIDVKMRARKSLSRGRFSY